MHCVCVVRSRSCVACRPETRKKERKKREREKDREKSATRIETTPLPFSRHPSKGVAREGEGVCARASRGGTTRRDAANAWTRAACSRVYRVANHSRHPRPITYWFFTYDLIHYHSVIYICPARCGFRGFRGFREPGLGRVSRVGEGEEGGKKGKNKRGKKQNVYTRRVERVA